MPPAAAIVRADNGATTNARPRRLLPCVAVLLTALALAGPAAAQNLGGPDAPPGATPAPAPTEVTPAPAPTPTPTPSVAPDAPADPAATPADPATTTGGAAAPDAAAQAEAAAAAEHARALRAAAQRRRIRENIAAIRTAALEGGQALAGTRAGRARRWRQPLRRRRSPRTPTSPPAAAGSGPAGPARRRRPRVRAGGLPSVSRRGGALERVRLELAGVSVACLLVLLMVLAGIV